MQFLLLFFLYELIDSGMQLNKLLDRLDSFNLLCTLLLFGLDLLRVKLGLLCGSRVVT